jgi:hypothetical protein
MKKSLPCLSALVALVTCVGATAQDRPVGMSAAGQVVTRPEAMAAATATAAGDRLLVQAVNQLEQHSSVTARMRHQATVGGVDLYGVGNYWQQGSGDTLRVRMELQVAGQDATLLQVSNRGILWIDQRLPSGRSVTRVNLRQLRADPVLSAGELESIQPGEASWSPMRSELTAHSGGLSSLLASLGERFSFLPPQAMRLALAPPLAEQATNIPVFAMVGHWRPEKLAELTGKSQESNDKSREPESARKSSERLPQEVLLLLGQRDLFPYRIEYRRLETPRAANADGTTVSYQLSAEPVVVLELSDVTFDVPIDGGQFDFNPKDVNWVDQTAKLLERLRKQRQAEIAQRGGAGQPR